jgi:hypothetical protein
MRWVLIHSHPTDPPVATTTAPGYTATPSRRPPPSPLHWAQGGPTRGPTGPRHSGAAPAPPAAAGHRLATSPSQWRGGGEAGCHPVQPAPRALGHRTQIPTSRYRGAPGEEGAGLYARLCTGPQRCRDRLLRGAGIMTPRTGRKASKVRLLTTRLHHTSPRASSMCTSLRKRVAIASTFPRCVDDYWAMITAAYSIVIYPCHVVNSVRFPIRVVRFSAATAAFFLTDDLLLQLAEYTILPFMISAAAGI